MEQILLMYGLLKETVTAVMMIYTRAIVPLLNSNTDFFDIVAGVLQRDILAPYMFISSLDNILQTSIDFIKASHFT